MKNSLKHNKKETKDDIMHEIQHLSSRLQTLSLKLNDIMQEEDDKKFIVEQCQSDLDEENLYSIGVSDDLSTHVCPILYGNYYIVKINSLIGIARNWGTCTSVLLNAKNEFKTKCSAIKCSGLEEAVFCLFGHRLGQDSGRRRSTRLKGALNAIQPVTRGSYWVIRIDQMSLLARIQDSNIHQLMGDIEECTPSIYPFTGIHHAVSHLYHYEQ